MRRNGKSWAANAAKEAALDAGQRVMLVTKDSVTIQRRKKHLTMIETLPPIKPQSTAAFHDHLRMKDPFIFLPI